MVRNGNIPVIVNTFKIKKYIYQDKRRCGWTRSVPKQLPSPASIPLHPRPSGEAVEAARKNKLIKRHNGLAMVFAVPAGSSPNNTSLGTPSGVASFRVVLRLSSAVYRKKEGFITSDRDRPEKPNDLEK